MIEKEKFIKIIQKHIDTQKYIDDVQKVTKIDVFETPWYENCFGFFDAWLDEVVKEPYQDTVTAYLWPEDNWEIESYDRPEHPLEIFYKDGAVNKIGTVEQLYTYLKENDGFCTNS